MIRKLKNALLQILHYRFNLDKDKANEEDIKASLRQSVEFRGTNLWALIFAIFIASIGLNVNSTAVIIGAMLISPLMGPIMGVGLGAGTFDLKLIRYSLKNLFVAAAISIATSGVYFWLTPLKAAQSELLARTSPTIWDVLIALFGGLAGIVASSRKNISNAIPGVAIATALMPPLCTAGYGVGTGNLNYFLGAFYLFLINCVFISISTFLVIRFLKFHPAKLTSPEMEKRVRLAMWTIAILTIIPSIFLAVRFVHHELFKQNLRIFMHQVVEKNSFYVINENVKPTMRSVSWIVYGEKPLDSLALLIDTEKAKYGLQDATFQLRQTTSANLKAEDRPLQNESSPLLENATSRLVEMDDRIRHLESTLRDARKSDTAVYREFKALFGKVASFSIEKSVLQADTGRTDSVLLVYIKDRRWLDRRKIERWLRSRYANDSVVVAFAK